MQIIDTHCHVHDPEYAANYASPITELLKDAEDAGVEQYICVGTSVASSIGAVEFAQNHTGAYASLAIHPHEAEQYPEETLAEDMRRLELIAQKSPRGEAGIVAIGECGLDYYYHKTPESRQRQQFLFRLHVDLALQCDLPMIFHIREAFDDFFKILDEYAAEGHVVQGVVHSFTAHEQQLSSCIDRGLYIGLNGIMTFTKDSLQLAAAKKVPKDRLLLETDAPFLTPVPFRGKMCEIKHITLTAEFLAALRGEDVAELAHYTTQNAKELFRL